MKCKVEASQPQKKGAGEKTVTGIKDEEIRIK